MRNATRQTTEAQRLCADEACRILQQHYVAYDCRDRTIVWQSEHARDLQIDPAAIAEAIASSLSETKPGSAPRTARLTQNEQLFDIQFARAPHHPETVFLRLDDASQFDEAHRRKLSERERLLSISREIAVGEIATTLAHELNQPLGAIVNIVRGVRVRMAGGATASDEVLAVLEQAAQQAIYASQVIARIRSFVAARAPQVQPIEISALVKETIGLLDWEIRRGDVKLQIEIDAQLPAALGDFVMIQQVLVNLVRNAIEAMAHNAPSDRRLRIRSVTPASADCVEIVISDEGHGLSEEAALRLFSPFNSSKPDGMGVGLSICRSIIEFHRGRLWASNNNAGGADFHLTLPASERLLGDAS